MLISRLPQLEQGYSLDLDSMIFSRHGTQQQGAARGYHPRRPGSGANLKGSASGGNGLNDRTDLGAGTLQGSAFRPRNYCPVRAEVPDIQAQLP